MYCYFDIVDLNNLVALARGSSMTPTTFSREPSGELVSSYRLAGNDDETRLPDGSRLEGWRYPFVPKLKHGINESLNLLPKLE